MVGDGERRLRYDPGSRLPSAIVMAGWGGVVSIEAMRFCASHGVAIIVLDWMRELMTVMPARASESAAMLRAQASADPLPIAIRIVQAKIASAARAGAIEPSDAARFMQAAGRARIVQEAMIAEAQAARRMAEPARASMAHRIATHSAAMETAAANSIANISRGQNEASRNASAQRSFERRLFRHVRAARGDARRSWRASGYRLFARRQWRPLFARLRCDRAVEADIEKAVFGFVRKHQFSPNDFIRIKDGSIRLGSN